MGRIVACHTLSVVRDVFACSAFLSASLPLLLIGFSVVFCSCVSPCAFWWVLLTVNVQRSQCCVGLEYFTQRACSFIAKAAAFNNFPFVDSSMFLLC